MVLGIADTFRLLLFNLAKGDGYRHVGHRSKLHSCMSIYLSIYIYTKICMYAYIYMCVCKDMYIYIYIFICTFMHIIIYMYMYKYVFIYMYIYLYLYIYVHIYIHINIHIYTYIYIYIEGLWLSFLKNIYISKTHSVKMIVHSLVQFLNLGWVHEWRHDLITTAGKGIQEFRTSQSKVGHEWIKIFLCLASSRRLQ